MVAAVGGDERAAMAVVDADKEALGAGFDLAVVLTLAGVALDHGEGELAMGAGGELLPVPEPRVPDG